jgi:hypothetical protein
VADVHRWRLHRLERLHMVEAMNWVLCADIIGWATYLMRVDLSCVSSVLIYWAWTL